jgi:hypothetical protein
MSVTPSPIGGFAAQFFDNNGVILSGGKIYTYAAGTTTPQTTYTSASGVTPHANPIILDSAGRVPGGEIWLTDGLVYKFVIETATGILLGTYDNITGVNSNFVNYTIQEEVITATAGQTVFNLSTINYTPGTNSLTVYIDGVNQYVGDSYLETDSDTVTFTSGVHVGGEVKFTTAIQTTTGSVNADIVAYDPPFTGGVATNQEAYNSRIISVKDFGAVGDGVTNDTVAIQNAVNAAEGRTLLGVEGETYLIRDEIVVPSNVTMDWQGANILDDVQTFRPVNQASRAKPLFYMYGVNNIKIKNLVYEAAATRATVSTNVPTGIIWMGDNSTTGNGPTHDIEITNIQASNCADYTLFVAIVGNAYDIVVRNIDIQGDCDYGINIEYGEAATGPTPPDNYGMYPYNVTVENFNGYDNATSVGFLRVAAAYNIKFLNCYGENVTSFIYAWTGDRSIQRVSENVVFENCSHYAGASFATGVVNYCVQVLSVDKDGSTGVTLPVWTNQEHLFTFNNCQFQNNKETDSAALRFYGSQGSTVFNSCIFQDSYFGLRAGPATNPSYTSLYSLRFNDCVFKNNSRDVILSTIRGVVFDHCKFVFQDGTLIPVKLEFSAIYNEFKNCLFYGLATDIAYVVIDAGCTLNKIEYCLFADTGATPPLDLSAETLGSNNLPPDQGLVRTGYAYYGVAGEPQTLIEDLANVSTSQLDADKRTLYPAGNITKSLTGCLNGTLNTTVRVTTESVGSAITFVHNDGGETTTSRIITSTGANVTISGSGKTATLLSTANGWYLTV